MTYRLHSIMRRLGPLLGAGILLQASGCQFNPSELAAGLTTTVLNNLIASFVFGVFNVGF